MRKLFVPLGLACLALMIATVSFAGTPASQAPESITIDACQAKKAPVTFPHKAHFERLDCVTCHHTQEGLKAGSDIEVENCASCHQNPEKAETPDCAQMSMSKNPFHLLCVNCHKEEVKKNAELKAPTKCDECHPKG